MDPINFTMNFGMVMAKAHALLKKAEEEFPGVKSTFNDVKVTWDGPKRTVTVEYRKREYSYTFE